MSTAAREGAAAPLVSVVIPAYNSEQTLEATVASALGQTFTDLEVVIVDDGSSDATLALAESLTDPRVRVISQPNAGAAAARNTGWSAARGHYVAFLDADDLWLAHKLERQLEILQGRSDVAAVQAGAYFVDNDLQLLSVQACRAARDPLLETLRFQNLPCAMTTLVVERALLERVGGLDTSLVILEEWDMMIKAARYGNMQAVEEPLALYRVHAGNRSRDLDIHIEPGFRVLDGLFADPELPARVRRRRRELYGRFYTMLCGGAVKVGRWREAARWGRKALTTDPRMALYMLELPARWLRRRRSRHGAELPGAWEPPAAQPRIAARS